MLERKRADACPEDLAAAYNLAADHKVPAIVHQSAYVNAISSNKNPKQVKNGNSSESLSAPRFKGICHNCQKKGHKVQGCPQPSLRTSRVNDNRNGKRKAESSSEDML